MSALVTSFGILSAAGIAGGLALPLTRQYLLGDIRNDWLCRELNFDRIHEDGSTVELKDGGLFQVYRLAGVLYESKDLDHQRNFAQSRALVFGQLRDHGVTIRLFGVKRHREIDFSADWPTHTLDMIGTKERTLFRTSFNVDWFIMLSGHNRRKLIEAGVKLESLMSDYQPSLLQRAEDAQQHCDLTAFLHYLITGEYPTYLPSCHHNISANIPACDLIMNKSGVMETRSPIHYFHSILAVKAWPEEVSGQLSARLMALPLEIELCQILTNLTDEKAFTSFKLKRQQYSLPGPFSNSSIASDYDLALDLMADTTKNAVFEAQYQICVRAKDYEALQAAIVKITDILGKFRINYSIETKGLPVCWFNRMPGHGGNKLLRPLKLFSFAIAALWPFAASPSGMNESPWDNRPVRLFPTPSGQSYAFQFHNSVQPQSLGHFFVFAPSGSGKSTLILHLLAGLAKMNRVRSYIFDSKEGTRFMVEAFGGQYQNFEKLALNPLDVGDNHAGNRQMVKQVLMAMLGDIELSPMVDEELDRAVEQAFMVKPPNRTLNTLYETAFSRHRQAKQAFARWVIDKKRKAGAYSHIFNSGRDSLAGFLSDQFMVGINMNEALEDETLAPAIVTHISQVISRTASRNSKGFAIFVDEAAKLLQNEGFKLTVQEMFREYRKQNGVVGLAFQDPAALFRSGISESLIENVATMFFFPNPRGKVEQYQAFNLSEEELGFILTGVGKEPGQRPVLVVKEDSATGHRSSAIIDTNLAPYGKALSFYRSGVDAVKLMEQLQSEHGEQWAEHL